MLFIDLPTAASVFLDANILVYYFTPDPTFGAECQVLMERIYKWQDFVAYTSTHVLGEMAHQLMILEAARVAVAASCHASEIAPTTARRGVWAAAGSHSSLRAREGRLPVGPTAAAGIPPRPWHQMPR